MSMTTPRENMMRIFRHETPEWIPVAGHCDPFNQPSREGMDPKLAAALGEVQWGDESTVNFSRYLGLDILDWYGLSRCMRITRRNVELNSKTEGDTTTNVWHTPKGDLREITQVCRDATGAVSSNRIEYLVKGANDLPALAAIFEDEVVEPDPEGIERTRKRRELIGDDGLLMGVTKGTPLGMMYRVYSGVSTLAYLWADAPEALRDCFDVMERTYLRYIDVGVQLDVDAIVTCDDTSTTAISPAMFEAFNMDVTDERAGRTHQAGKLYFHHSCGLIRDLLGLYRQTNMDAVHAFTVPPTGNVTIAEGRRLLGDQIAIIAGVPQLAQSLDDPQAIRNNLHEMILEAKPWDHFLLHLAAEPNRTMEQTRFVADCCREIKIS